MPLHLTLDVEDEASQAKREQQLDNTLAALAQGLIRLGGAKSRGLGCIKLETCKRQVQRLSTREGLLDLLKQKAEGTAPASWAIPATVAQAPPQLKLLLDWKPIGAVMVKSEQSGVAVDILPLMSRLGTDHLGFVLPGSSIKGALRSQAERILRTVLRSPSPSNQKFAEQIQLPLVCHLFGTAAQTDKSKEKQTYSTWASALFVEDCFSQQSYDTATFGEIATADSKHIRSALDAVDADNIQQAYHVAIDRWTGGAADQFLYTAIEPFNIAWEPIEIGLKLHQLKPGEDEPAIALLLLLLRDFANQRIPLGYGVNRGYGTVQLKQAKFELIGSEYWPSQLQTLHNKTTNGKDLSELSESLLKHLQTAWGKWIEQHSSKQEGVSS